MPPQLKTVALSLLRIGSAALVLAAVALWAGVRWLERNKLFYPNKVITVIPRSLGMEFEDVTLTAADGVKLNGWFIPAAKPGLTVLFCHGNAGNISNRVEKAAILHRLGLNVFVFDYRGFGKSEGSPTEKGTYLDADAAYGYLTKTRGIPPDRIV
ncbi:alpha/beta hydrolase, partial [bacterium]